MPQVRTIAHAASIAAAACALAGAAGPGRAQATTAQTRPPAPGVTQLPLTPPPTAMQAPLPAPAVSLPRADRPLLSSPDLRDIQGRLASQPLTIADAVALALGTNRSMSLAQEALLRATGRTAEARAAFSPTLGANATYTRLNQGQVVNIGGATIPIVNADQPTLGLTATLPIDIAGLLRAATDQARFQEIAARLDINRTRNQIVLDVKSAFYDVLRAQALVQVATENLQNSLDRLDDANKRYRAGVVARFDVLRAETDVLNAQQSLISARSQVSLAIATLNNQIGLDINTPLMVTEAGAVTEPPDVPAPGSAPAPPPAGQAPPQPAAQVRFDSLNLGPEYDAVSREAVQVRPEILEADANIAAARKGIALAQRSRVPTLGVSVSGLYNPNAGGFAPQTTTAQAVVSLNVPIFEGGFARARTIEARADVATAETNRRQALDAVVLEVRSAYLALLQARDRVAVANQALSQAQEAFRLARVRYNAGVSAQAGISPLLEVSDAQAALTQAETNRVNALYDYNESRARLDKAIGRYSFTASGPGYSSPPAIKR
ncbi:MAG TPA: TolC family protein [Chthonomonadaceae bacterium]|nr:TolC family protein [Chthonomonadaceae bacterium]